jgi:hypothetical protein
MTAKVKKIINALGQSVGGLVGVFRSRKVVKWKRWVLSVPASSFEFG